MIFCINDIQYQQFAVILTGTVLKLLTTYKTQWANSILWQQEAHFVKIIFPQDQINLITINIFVANGTNRHGWQIICV